MSSLKIERSAFHISNSTRAEGGLCHQPGLSLI
jgi:hypothetical protein